MQTHLPTVNRFMLSFLWGVAITTATMLLPYQYCMDGPGRGFPFAVFCPMCGAWLPVFSFDQSKIPQILDLGAFIGDVLLWGVAAGYVRTWLTRPRAQSTTGT